MFSAIKAFFTKKNSGRSENLHLSDVSSTFCDDSEVHVKEKKPLLGFKKNIFSKVSTIKFTATRETRGSRTEPQRKEGLGIVETSDNESEELLKNKKGLTYFWRNKVKRLGFQLGRRLGINKKANNRGYNKNRLSKGHERSLKKRAIRPQEKGNSEKNLENEKKQIPVMNIYDIWEMMKCSESIREQLRTERIREEQYNREKEIERIILEKQILMNIGMKLSKGKA
ncbi:hypothetical protein BB560_007325 [Smittium megazygosporum]|uniref:Uncharacterized protein n=1 Tax=Smittium megazygosporum TaxID=133381 RepID=A0A2T9XWQ3_9FUNG|nr:hypothetical protein BB560_007325 [Smittium megazygosporum]